MRESRKRCLTIVIGALMLGAGCRAQVIGHLDISDSSSFCAGAALQKAPFLTYGSYCHGDKTVGRLVTGTFHLAGPFKIYISGRPNSNGQHLQLENVTQRQILDIRPNVSPGVDWLKSKYEIPESWRSNDLRSIPTDTSTKPMGWLAFSGPFLPDNKEAVEDAKNLLLKCRRFGALLFLPGLALTALAINIGMRGIVKLGLVALIGISFPGYFVFFAYVFSARAGFVTARILPYISGCALLFFLVRLGPRQRRLLLSLAIPMAATLLGSMSILSLGFLYGGVNTPMDTPSNRFSHPLPMDNQIPWLFAEGLVKGSVPKPMLGDWLSSDRPPLQTGAVLALKPWIRSNRLSYQVVSAIFQSLWIFATWLLMRAFRICRLSTVLVIVTTAFSGFAIVNTFFVWPKLLAATYMIAFAIPVLTAKTNARRSLSWILRCLMGALLALSLLAHGATIFALIGLLLFVVVRQFRSLRLISKEAAIIGGITFFIYSPWLAYQRFIDPPGDRLIKWHLGGVEDFTTKSASQVIHDSYSRLTLSQWLAYRRADLDSIFGHEIEYLRAVRTFTTPGSKAHIRAVEFFCFMPALGLTGFGLVGLLWRWSGRRVKKEMTAADRLLLWAAVSLVPWILLMFKPSTTIVHQSAYATVLAAMAGAILAFRSIAPYLAAGVCVIQCVLHWLIYEPDLTRADFPNSPALSANHWMMVLHLASFCGFVALLTIRVKSASRAELLPRVEEPATAPNR